MLRPAAARPPAVVPAVASFLRSEVATALDWQPGSSSCLAVGQQDQWVHIVDSRRSRSVVLELDAHDDQRDIVSVLFQPGRPERVMSMTEGGDAKVWDLRRADAPLVVIEAARSEGAGLSVARWCPSGRGTIATVSTAGSVLELWEDGEVRPWSSEAAGVGMAAASEPAAAEPAASLGGAAARRLRTSEAVARREFQAPACGMDWPYAWGGPRSSGAVRSRVLVATGDGRVHDVASRSGVASDVAVGAGGVEVVTVADTRAAVRAGPASAAGDPSDIATRIRRRVAAGVGLNPARSCLALSRAVAALAWQHAMDRVLALAAQAGGAAARRGPADGRAASPSASRSAGGGAFVTASSWASGLSDGARRSPAHLALQGGALVSPAFGPRTDGSVSAGTSVVMGPAGAAAGRAVRAPPAWAFGLAPRPRSLAHPSVLELPPPAARPSLGTGAGGAVVADSAVDEADDDAGLLEDAHGGVDWTLPGPAGGSAGDLGGPAGDPEVGREWTWELRRQSKDLRGLRALWEWVAGPEAAAAAAQEALRDRSASAVAIAGGTMPAGASVTTVRAAAALPPVPRSPPPPGVAEILSEDGAGSDTPAALGPFVCFASGHRDRAAEACGWMSAEAWAAARSAEPDAAEPRDLWVGSSGGVVAPLGVRGRVPAFVQRCLAEDKYERAAALAVWHGDLRLATAVLRAAAVNAESQIDALYAARLAARDTPRGVAAAPVMGSAAPGESLAWQRLLETATADPELFRRAIQQAQERRELMQLTAMAVAGFPGVGPDAAAALRAGVCVAAWPEARDDATTAQLWAETCDGLRARMRDRHPYLRSLCAFLASCARPVPSRAQGAAASSAVPSWWASPFLPILREAGLRFQDRAAFAARFLPAAQQRAYVVALHRGAVASGNILGLVLTGFGSAGCRVIQAYVDRTGDIHTGALLACFFQPHRVSANAARRAMLWIQALRDLLNRWRMWRERAAFDVQRAKMSRAFAAHAPSPRTAAADRPSTPADLRKDAAILGDLEPAGTQKPTVYAEAVKTARVFSSVRGRHSRRGASAAGRTRPGAPLGTRTPAEPVSASAAMSTAERLLGAVVTQQPAVYAYCSFCNTALALPYLVSQSGTTLHWIRNQRHRMMCCAKCKGMLPRCSLCLLSMGSINPYKQMQSQLEARQPTRDKDGKRPAAMAAAAAVDPLSAADPADRPDEKNATKFGDWWTWCQSCRHGGHASHLAAWFKSHDVCPVAGCRCRCRGLDTRALSAAKAPTDDPAIPLD